MLPKIKDEVTKTLTFGEEIFVIRPWKTRDEKNLMIKQSSMTKAQSENEFLQNRVIIDSFVKGCVIEGNVDTLSYNQLKHLIIELRCISTGEIMENLTYKCPSCEKTNQISINLYEEGVVKYKGFNSDIHDVSDKLKIKIKAIPNIMINEKTTDFDALYNSIEEIIYEGKSYRDFSREDFEEFFDSLDIKTSSSLLSVIRENVDSLEISKEYTCIHCGEKRKIDFSELPNFFNP